MGGNCCNSADGVEVVQKAKKVGPVPLESREEEENESKIEEMKAEREPSEENADTITVA